ncbi:MAG TPA: hypothetical protein VFX96_05925 [Pyrinomonadaceae bacterium]|nr:hypothetical protein [Pyrinomonadaceae bacterium]
MADGTTNVPTLSLDELKKSLEGEVPPPPPVFFKEVPTFTLGTLPPPYPDHPYFVAAEHHPFKPRAEGFEMVNAWWLAEAATLAYSDAELVERRCRQAGFTQVAHFDRGGTQCFVASNEEFVIVAFRGSESRPRPPAPGRRASLEDLREVYLDWVVSDFDFLPVAFEPGARVHGGFEKSVKRVWDDDGEGFEGVGSYLARLGGDGRARAVWVTGHSLGAALATLAAARCDVLQGVYSFGSPRVGDEAFGEFFGRRMKERFGGEYYRFVHNRDLVTTVPPPGLYEHVGRMKYIDRHGVISDEPTLWERVKNRTRALLTIPFDRLGRFKPGFIQLVPQALIDHAPTLYAVHIWNAYVNQLK